MARCSSCNKFVGYDDSTEPETNLEFTEEGSIVGNVRVSLTCAECGTDLKETSLEFEEDLSDQFAKHFEDVGIKKDKAGNDIPIEAEFEEKGSELIVSTEGKGRGLKTYYGASIEYEVTCECEVCKKNPDKAFSISDNLTDRCQASSMDECC